MSDLSSEVMVWHPCAKRLPGKSWKEQTQEESEVEAPPIEVLAVICYRNGEREVRPAIWYAGAWMRDKKLKSYGISHWMPMPELPPL